jgi:hypothetical protein
MSGWEKGIILLDGSQTSPSRPSGNGNMKVKTLELLEVQAWDRCSGILAF